MSNPTSRAPWCLALLVCVCCSLCQPARAELEVTRLRTEYRENPLGVDSPRPRLSWVLRSATRGDSQSAYRILVASSERLLAADEGDLWDSGKVESSRSVQVEYAGRPLVSRQRVWWKVRAWDASGKEGSFSASAWWEMALLRADDWQARWIAAGEGEPADESGFYADRPSPLLRKSFRVDREIVRARAYVCGLGYYELTLNGQRVGDSVLDPPWTDVSRRVVYAVHDVTGLLRRGENAVGAMLGRGWYDPLPLRMWGRINLRQALTVGEPRLLCQLELELAGGERRVIGTDGTWKVAPGPLLRDSVYLGEVFDARREPGGWRAPGFDPSGWQPAVPVDGPGGVLRARSIPPIRVREVLRPVRVTEPEPGVHIVDFGVNFAGRIALTVDEPAGTVVRIRYGELLHPDGRLNPMTTVCGQIKRAGVGGPGAPDVAWQGDTYVTQGGARETFRPRFAFRGFRFAEIRGVSRAPSLDAVVAESLSTAVAIAGDFDCSEPLWRRLHEVVRRTFLSNLFSVQSDCPAREKFGYGGDIVATAPAALLEFDMAAFYAKTVRDFADAARSSGGLTETAPFVGIADRGLAPGAGPVGWGTVHPLLLVELWRHYGDRRLLRQQYPVARRWLEFLEGHAPDGIIEPGIGDHEGIERETTELTSTAFFAHNADLLERAARILGEEDDASRFRALGSRIRRAYRARFRSGREGVYGRGTQAGQAFTLALGLATAAERPAALKALLRDVIDEHDHHLTTGIFGTRYALDVLSREGRADVVGRVVRQRSFPGWGFMLERGATTLWEHWAFSDNTYSHNHPMFGSVSEWLYAHVAGLAPAVDAEAFDRIVVRPSPLEGLGWARARHESIRGPVESSWRVDGETFRLDLSVPVGAVATVFLPAVDPRGVRESGARLEDSSGVERLPSVGGRVVCRVGSGSFRFEVQNVVRPGEER